MSDFNFNIDIQKVLKKLTQGGEIEMKMKASVGLYCDTAAKKMESYAKQNARWTDRTGNARQTIKGGFKWEDANRCRVYIAGNMNYSPYLELAHADKSVGNDVGMEVGPTFEQLELGNEGKYAILRPTVRKYSPEFIRGMNNLLGK
jgi:hypothetical protein